MIVLQPDSTTNSTLWCREAEKRKLYNSKFEVIQKIKRKQNLVDLHKGDSVHFPNCQFQLAAKTCLNWYHCTLEFLWERANIQLMGPYSYVESEHASRSLQLHLVSSWRPPLLWCYTWHPHQVQQHAIQWLILLCSNFTEHISRFLLVINLH